MKLRLYEIRCVYMIHCIVVCNGCNVALSLGARETFRELAAMNMFLIRHHFVTLYSLSYTWRNHSRAFRSVQPGRIKFILRAVRPYYLTFVCLTAFLCLSSATFFYYVLFHSGSFGWEIWYGGNRCNNALSLSSSSVSLEANALTTELTVHAFAK